MMTERTVTAVLTTGDYNKCTLPEGSAPGCTKHRGNQVSVSELCGTTWWPLVCYRRPCVLMPGYCVHRRTPGWSV